MRLLVPRVSSLTCEFEGFSGGGVDRQPVPASALRLPVAFYSSF